MKRSSVSIFPRIFYTFHKSVGSGNWHVYSGANFNNNISLEGGYQPAPPASFQVMSFGSRAGTFTTINGVSIGNGNKLDPVYGATDLTLEVVTE